MSRSYPIGLAILILRDAIANYKEQKTEESLKALKHARWKAGRNITPLRKGSVYSMFLKDYIKSLNIEIEKARTLIWGGWTSDNN